MRLATPRLAALLIAAVGAATPALAADTPIIPGYWESRNRVLLGKMTWSDKVERKCVTPKDIDKVMAGPSNRHYKCTYPEKNFDDGKVMFNGWCVDKRGRRINVKVTGTYTPTSFEMGAALSTKIAGLPLSGGATTKSHRIGDVCPPGSGFDDKKDDKKEAAAEPAKTGG